MTISESDVSVGDHADVMGYLLGTLTDLERSSVDGHLTSCEDCRTEISSLQEWTDALEAVPSAMQLDGPPEGGDLLLQRALRQVRAESGSSRRRRGAALGAVAAVAAVAAFAAGAITIPGTASVTPLAQGAASAPAVAPGGRTLTTTDSASGARITVAVVPGTGWVRLHAAVAGIPAGERCRLEVVATDGTTQVAGSWLVSAAGQQEGTTLDGSALVDPSDVAAVQVVNTNGRRFVRATT